MAGEIYKKEIPVVAPEFRVANSDSIVRVPAVGGAVREIAVATYDVTGGDDGATGAHGLGVYIPDNAIITRAWYDVVTTFVSPTSDAATIALSVQAANDLVSAIAISNASNVYDAGVHGTLVGYPNLGADAAHDTALEVIALFVGTFKKMTARRELTATVGVEGVTAGKLRLFVEYVISD